MMQRAGRPRGCANGSNGLFSHLHGPFKLLLLSWYVLFSDVQPQSQGQRTTVAVESTISVPIDDSHRKCRETASAKVEDL